MNFVEYAQNEARSSPDFSDKEALFQFFCRFGNLQILSGDIDPTYPVLRKIYDNESLSENSRLWRTYLYVTLYNLGSAHRIWTNHPSPELPPLDILRQPTGIERRGFRARPDLVQKHLGAMLDLTGGDLVKWTQAFGEGEDGWNAARDAMRSFPWGGNWSAYKWADLLTHTHGLPLVSPDFGVGGGSATAGPIPGMVILTGLTWQECATNIQAQRDFYAKCKDAGALFKGMDQVETSLCDFNSLCKGHYYVGHDIDCQMDHFKSGAVPESIWSAREVFRDKDRGELNGWFGVRNPRKRLFVDESKLEAC